MGAALKSIKIIFSHLDSWTTFYELNDDKRRVIFTLNDSEKPPDNGNRPYRFVGSKYGRVVSHPSDSYNQTTQPFRAEKRK